MPSSPSVDPETLEKLRAEREAYLISYIDGQVQEGLLRLFMEINSDIALSLAQTDTEGAKLEGLLSNQGIWLEIDPLLKIDRLEIFKQSIKKFSGFIEGDAWSNYQREMTP